MDMALATLASPLRRDAEIGRFLNWLACWIVLPNLPFLAVTLLGGPPRCLEIFVCGVVGLLARHLHLWLRRLVFIVLMGWVLVTFIGHMFNMAPTMILLVAPLLLYIRPAVSAEYVVGALLIAASVMAGLRLLRSAQGFTRLKWVLSAVVSILALAGFDFVMSKDTMGAYGRLAPKDAPF